MDWKDRVRAELQTAPQLPDDEVVEELAQHARAMFEAARADGSSEDEAHRAVAFQLERWRTEAAALRHRSRRRPAVDPPPAVTASPLAGLMHDVRYAVRVVRRQPRPALLTIVTMALGIGATTALFSVTYGVLMKPLPWRHADRLVMLKETRGGNSPRFGAFTNAAYLAWREQSNTIDNIAAWSQRMVTLSGASDPERIRVTAATATLFPVLGARPLLGTFFGEKDERAPVIVLSESLWRQRFGSDPGALGKVVQLDGQAYTIVGVLADDEAYPDRQSRAIVPFSVSPAVANYLSMFNAIAALRPRNTAAQAAAEGTARARFAADTGLTTRAVFGRNGPIEITAVPLRDAVTADVRLPLSVLLIAVGLLLVTATANVANLQLARATARSREMAIRAAIGAGGARITRQLLVETLILGLSGGLLGVALAWALHRSIPSLLPADFPRVDDLGIDVAVIAFAVIVTAGTSLAFGLLPALHLRRVNLVEALAEEGTAPSGAGIHSRTARARMVIMTAQVAIACVLLVGASLLGRSFVALLHADRGFDPADVLTARLSMPEPLYPAQERRFTLIDQILTRVAAIPTVPDVAFTSELPLTRGGSTSAFTMKSPTAEEGVVSVQASPRIVSPRYFSTVRMHTMLGRTFSDGDTESSEHVVVVNQSFARRYLGNSPLGAKLPLAGYASRDEDQIESTVIGVVDDVRYVTVQDDVSQPELFYSYRQLRRRLPVQTVTLLIRSSGDPAIVAASLRSVVRDADDRLVVDAITPLEQRLLTTLARPRLYSMLLGGFAAFAFLTAAVGLFGLISYSVSQRSRELALRTALGAGWADILQLVLRQGLVVTVAGLIAGMLAASWLARLLATQLYGITPHDPLTLIAVPLALLIVSAVACVIPAWRAANIDPVKVMRG
jgi:putative ABC transport system permease protein